MKTLRTGRICGGNCHGSTEKKADKASSVECLEQGKAHLARLGHPLHPFSSPEVLTSVLPLDLDGCRRESEVGDAQPFFTLIKFIAQVIDHLPSHLSSTESPVATGEH